jgi:tRNA-splicing ligase RtcB (3'-phosphate/5'-hydroxy nucleic acid ligase)
MIFGTHDQNTLDQFAGIQQQSVKSALMADGHFGYVMPVGGVAAYDNKVSVVGVGFDIACGNCAIKTNLTIDQFMPEYLSAVADTIAKYISFGVGRSNVSTDAPVDAKLFTDDRWKIIPREYRDSLREKARDQLGTVGSGNHYVDVFVNKADGSIWVGVHFGSRGLGHTIASNYLAIGQGGKWGDKGKEVETLLDLNTLMGKDYWDLMELAGEYAYAGREWVTRKVVSILGGDEVDMVHNHHNFAWKEEHSGQDLIVVRKGATPAFPGQRGFVGGSMGDDSVILKGSEYSKSYIGYDDAIQSSALYSTVHGAGRVMSRTEAAGKRDRKTGELKRDKVTGEVIKPGRVTSEMMREWLDDKGVILRGGGLDESPHAYRRLTDVLAAQGDTIEVLHVLTPLIVVMAGANEFDPYKD